jgi:hypothetical protein
MACGRILIMSRFLCKKEGKFKIKIEMEIYWEKNVGKEIAEAQ